MYRYHLYLYRIKIFMSKKLGSTKDYIFTFRVFDAESKTKFANNSLKWPKIGKLNIDTLIIPQGLLIQEKNHRSKISCYCPFKG